VDGTFDAVTCLFSSVGYLRSERDLHLLIGSAEGIRTSLDTHELTLFESGQYEESLHLAGLVDIEIVASPMPGRDRFMGATTTR